MNTVFSYIVQRRLSQEKENVATEALAFILESSERGRSGLMKLLRGIAPNLPALRFGTQQTEGSARPDMWGWDGGTPHVFIENKFWAGLTENQPVEYLRLLARHPTPTVLLVVVPETRLETVWREFKRRLDIPNVTCADQTPPVNVPYVAVVDFGPTLATAPVLAITSWAKVLLAIEAELADEPLHRNDLLQLRALCDAADDDTSAPFSSTELTDQRTPSFVRRLSVVMQRAVELGVTKGVVSIQGLNPMSNWDQAGRYMSFPKPTRVDAWFGTHFRRWRERGSTPLWLVFSATGFGRADEVRKVLEPWAGRQGLDCVVQGDGFGVGIDLVPGEEQEHVIRSVVNRLTEVAAELSKLTATPEMTP